MPLIYLDAPCMFRCPHMFGCSPCMFGCSPCMFGCFNVFGWPPYVWMPPYVWIPHMFGLHPYVWMPPVCLGAPYIRTPLCMVRLPHIFGHPHMFGCPPYVWLPPVCLDSPQMYGCIQRYEGHPNIWGCLNIQGASKCMGHMDTP